LENEPNLPDLDRQSEDPTIPLSYFRPLKNVRGDKPTGFTMIERRIVDPIHPDRAGLRPPARPGT
jgi:hypothetical protein